MPYKYIKTLIKNAGFNVNRHFEIFDNGDGIDIYTVDYTNTMYLIELNTRYKLKNVTCIG